MRHAAPGVLQDEATFVAPLGRRWEISDRGCEFSSTTLDFDSELLEFAIKRRSWETKNLGTSSDVARSTFERLQDRCALDLLHWDQV